MERILLSYDCVDGLPSALFMQQFCALFCSLEMIRQLVNWFDVIMHLEMQILRLGMFAEDAQTAESKTMDAIANIIMGRCHHARC